MSRDLLSFHGNALGSEAESSTAEIQEIQSTLIQSDFSNFRISGSET